MTTPMIHISRPDGGFEMHAMSTQDVLSYLQSGTAALQDLFTIAQAAAALYNAQADGTRIDATVRAIEATTDAAEQAKLSL